MDFPISNNFHTLDRHLEILIILECSYNAKYIRIRYTTDIRVKLNEDHGTCCHDSLLGCERGYGFNDNKLNISYHKHIECLLVSKSNKMFH